MVSYTVKEADNEWDDGLLIVSVIVLVAVHSCICVNCQ